MEKKTFSTPDEKRSFDKGQLELVTLAARYFWASHPTAWLEMVCQYKTTSKYRKLQGADFFGRDETLAHLSFACAELLSTRTAGNAKRVAAFAHLLAIHIAEKYTNLALQRPDYHGGLPIARLRKVEDYVRAHLAESISIETLAELAELSPFHFSRVFKQTTGITPLQFVTRERMLQARQLIRETSRSVIEIALTMNTTSLPTQGLVASWPSLNCGVSMRSPESSIVLAAAVKGKSRSFRVTAGTGLLDLFTATPMQDAGPRCLPSVTFTPSGPLVYRWQIGSQYCTRSLIFDSGEKPGLASKSIPESRTQK
jgi:AraC-like DNA-binding protein